jgi:membrane-associated phospholipid phosphatase
MDLVERPPNRGFLRQVGARLRIYWPAKTAGLTLGMAGFFAAYFRLLHHPFFPVTVMPLTPLDRLIGFQPWTLALYVSLWVYVPLGCILQESRRELRAYAVAALGLGALGLGSFLVWPTAVPVVQTNWAAHPSVAILKSVDASGNACPSLHVAFAVFTALCLGRLLRDLRAGFTLRAANWLWCLGIVYSALATGQHVVVDALAGAPLGGLAGWMNRLHSGRSRRAEGAGVRDREAVRTAA